MFVIKKVYFCTLLLTIVQKTMTEAMPKAIRYASTEWVKKLWRMMEQATVWCLLSVLLATTSIVSAREQQRMFFSFDASNGLADNSAQTIRCSATGRMVISTIGHINFYDGDAFSHTDPKAENVFPLPKYNGHYHMYFDKFNHLWLKDRRSVTCVDLLTERFVDDVGGVLAEIGIKRPVDDLFGDRNNQLWFLSDDRLYSIEYQRDYPVRKGVEIQDVDVFRDSLMLQFYADGIVSAYSLKDSRHMWDSDSQVDNDTLKYDKSSVLFPYADLFFQIRNGAKAAVLLSFDVMKREWKEILSTPYHLNNMAFYRHRLYVASEYGYWIHDYRANEVRHRKELLLSNGRMLLTDINAIAFDRQGGMWIGTQRRGLLYSKPIRSPFIAYTWDEKEAVDYSALMDRKLPAQKPLDRHVNCQFKDSRGWIWTGLYTGLEVLRPGRRIPLTITRKDGLQNEMVRCIVEDNDHNIWVGTSYGVSHLIIRNNEISNIETFTEGDNVPNESFVNGRAMKLPDGKIVMQSLDHVICLNPSGFYRDSVRSMQLCPSLIHIQVNGQRVSPGMKVDGRVIIDKSVSNVREIFVDYNQNSVSLTFSGHNYYRPIQTCYRYRVKGLSDKWQVLTYHNSAGLVDRKGLFHLPLLALRPGTYEIEVQASMTDDNWQGEPYRWVLNVEQPWWRSTGIYLLLALIILALAFYNLHLFYRNMRMRLACRNEEKKLLRRIRNYTDRCNRLIDEVLTPYTVSTITNLEAEREEQNEFTQMMLQIVPYVNRHKGLDFNVRRMSELTGVESEHLYKLLTENIYKSPRPVAIRLRLQEASKLLENTDMTIEAIADQCRFVSPNYFIASFYHLYRLVPQEWRARFGKS